MLAEGIPSWEDKASLCSLCPARKEWEQIVGVYLFPIWKMEIVIFLYTQEDCEDKFIHVCEVPRYNVSGRQGEMET